MFFHLFSRMERKEGGGEWVLDELVKIHILRSGYSYNSGHLLIWYGCKAERTVTWPKFFFTHHSWEFRADWLGGRS